MVYNDYNIDSDLLSSADDLVVKFCRLALNHI